jgi:hypothetical protein
MNSKEKAQNQVDSIRRSVRAKEIIDTLQGYILDGVEYDDKRADKGLKLLEFALPKLKAIDHTSDGEALKIEIVKFADLANT